MKNERYPKKKARIQGWFDGVADAYGKTGNNRLPKYML